MKIPVYFIKSIANRPGYQLEGTPPRWHKTDHSEPAEAGGDQRRLKIALANVSRYSSLKTAKEAAMNQKYWTPVLLGDDGKYWVPFTNREAGILMRAGYEKAGERGMTKDKALDEAIDHLKTDSKQSNLPKEEKKEDAALVSKLKAAK